MQQAKDASFRVRFKANRTYSDKAETECKHFMGNGKALPEDLRLPGGSYEVNTSDIQRGVRANLWPYG